MKANKKAAKRQRKLEKLQAFEAAVRIDERRRFEEAARERAEDLENRHMYAQNVLSHAHLARLQMESANPNTPPLGRAIADLLGGESQ